MSQQYVLPSSVRLELEARRLHAAVTPIRLGELAPALILSGLPQAFDIFVWLIAAVWVFPFALFAGHEWASGVVGSLAICSLALAAWPAGAAIFRVVGQRYGGGVRVTAARVMLGASTAAIAFLPVHAGGREGAILLLGACRVAQGLAIGGLWNDAKGGAPGLARSRMGAATMTGLTALAGLALAAGVLGAMAISTERADFLDWGWRYPFFIGFVPNIVALFAQLRVLTTEAEPHGNRPALRLASVGGVELAD